MKQNKQKNDTPADASTGTTGALDGAAEAGAPLPGMAHEVNENGVFESPEVFPVPNMGGKKGGDKVTGEVLLAMNAYGEWFWGWNLNSPNSGGGAMPNVAAQSYPRRIDALRAGLEYLQVQCQALEPASMAKSAAAAVERELIALEVSEASGAEAPAPAAAETVTPRSYSTEYTELAVAKIQRNPANHRKVFNPVKLQELAESIKTEGLHQAIAVRALLEGEVPAGELPLGDPGAPAFELIFGERRWRAVQLAGLSQIASKVYHGLTRAQALSIALVENLQREDINAMEEAEGYADLMTTENLTQEAAAARVGRARSTVANALRLLRLPEAVRELIREGKLTAGHGVALARFVPKAGDEDKRPNWERIIEVMAKHAVQSKDTAGDLERGVPHAWELKRMGLAVAIHGYRPDDGKMTAALKKHPAYFSAGDGDWICMDPAHWDAEAKAQKEEARQKEEAAAKRKQAEVAKLSRSGRKQLRLEDLDRNQYRELDGVQAGLVELVPEDSRAAAKGHDGRKTVVVTDVELAERLAKAMMRQIKKNRREAVPSLQEKVEKAVAKLKKVGPRELAWLVWTITDGAGRNVYVHVDNDVAKRLDIKWPRGLGKIVTDDDDADDYGADDEPKRKVARLDALAQCAGVDLVKVMMLGRLEHALVDLVESGPDSTGGRLLKYWLESDTLWLLEETDEGRAELVEQVKAAPWYQRAVAGDPGAGEGTEDEN